MPTKPHFVVDPSFPKSKEVLSIPRRYRLAAIGAWTSAGAWSTEVQTDGIVPVHVLEELGVTPLLAEVLITATLWQPVTRYASGGRPWTVHGVPATAVQFRNWSKWQKTKVQWQKGARQNAERQERFRQRRSGDEDQLELREDNALQDDFDIDAGKDADAPGNALRNGPVVVREERELSKGISPVGSESPPTPLETFPDHCDEHRHDPTPGPCGFCGDTRNRNRRHKTQAADLEVVKRADANDRRRNCPDCRGTGLVEVDPFDDDNDTMTRCPTCRP